MNFDYYGYRGSFAFESPILMQSQDESLHLVATPYGPSASLQEALEEGLNVFEAQLADPDATNPFPKLTCLSPEENILYTSIQFINDFIYSHHNRESFNLGCDLAIFYKKGKLLYFTQIGWPLILLHQKNKTLPICSDYAFSPQNESLAPCLPTSLVGLESSINAKIQKINIEQKTELILLKSNQNPDSLLSLYPSPLEKIAESYAEADKEQGFWIGKISF